MMKMKFSNYFILFIICFCALSMNPLANYINVGSQFIIVPLPVFKESLESTMDLVQNVISTLSHIHVDKDDDRNLYVATSHCAHLLTSTAQVLNWSLSTIHQEDLGGDVISHTRTWLNASLGSQETCMEVFDGSKYSMVAERLKQVTTMIHELLTMLQPRQHQLDAKNDGDALFSEGMKLLQAPNLTVCQNGCGNFTRIMDAVAAAPIHSPTHFVIFVKKGVYNEYVNIDSKRSNLVLVGEGMDVTTISGHRSFGGGWETFSSATFAAMAQGFIAMDIGFENTAGPEHMQAVALLSGGDRSVFYRCKISGYQDSLLVQTGRQFYQECQISGTVDFIFGFGTAVFQNCGISLKKNVVGGRSVATAHGRFAVKDPSGFSFQFCNVSMHSSDLRGNVKATRAMYLGRPWGKFSRTVFMQSYMSNGIVPEGWLEWNGTVGLDTLYYGEYMNYGPGAAIPDRVKWRGYHVITNPSEADGFTVAKFIDGNSWLPSIGIPYTPGLIQGLVNQS